MNKNKTIYANWTNQFEKEYNIPYLFENRDKYLLEKKLQVDLPQKNSNIVKKKIKI